FMWSRRRRQQSRTCVCGEPAPPSRSRTGTWRSQRGQGMVPPPRWLSTERVHGGYSVYGSEVATIVRWTHLRKRRTTTPDTEKTMKKLLLLGAALFLFTATPAVAQSDHLEFIGGTGPNSTLASAVIAGNTIYLS